MGCIGLGCMEWMRCIGWDGLHECSGVEEGGLGGSEPPSCDLMGAQPPNSVNFFLNLDHIYESLFCCKRLV